MERKTMGYPKRNGETFAAMMILVSRSQRRMSRRTIDCSQRRSKEFRGTRDDTEPWSLGWTDNPLAVLPQSENVYCHFFRCLNSAALSIFQKEVWERIHLRMKIQRSPDITKEIVFEYIQYVSIPIVQSNRELPRCQEQPKVSFCLNFSSHCLDVVLQSSFLRNCNQCP
jgi:hypothetical protein